MALEGEYLIPGTPIPVERCDAPVLLIHGLKDRLWKAKRSKRLERRLKAAIETRSRTCHLSKP
jgi:pimeloyl-ACP methyl ester carboxylesterase